MNELENLVKRAEELRENDRIADAEDHVRYALERYEDSWELWSQLGHILSRKQESAEAAEAFMTATTLNPGEFWLWLYLGYAQRDLEDYESAIESTENALRVESGQNELDQANYNLACYYALLGRNKEAMDYLKEALENNDSMKEWAREDSDLNSLRSEPGFEFLVER
ncbi:tetratricopeptide repeat protein [Candidatus Thorarchaeota archaeon]|nr:MAG: tetratricopeptide repeat protein [Candidatus Thorarchaeota archaeon]